MQNFTFSDFIEINEKEQELKALFGNETKEEKVFSPKKQTIDNILNYSKALSVRKSKTIDCIEIVLN